MLSQEMASAVIDHAISLGANFAELFVERQLSASLATLSDLVDSVQSGVDFGIGIRLAFGQKILYGYTNKSQVEILKRIVSDLAAQDRHASDAVAKKLIQTPPYHQSVLMPLSTHPGLEEKIGFLRQVSLHAFSVSEKISQTKGFCLQREQLIQIFNSEGLCVEDTRHYFRAGMTAIASADALQATGSENYGAFSGLELLESVEPKALGEEISRQALVNLSAKPCPSGRMPVVMGNGFGGVIFHEACGHLLETTSVAKKASVFHDKLGELIASSCVNAVDDGTLGAQWGSTKIDDEGMETQRTDLIKDGKLVSFLADRFGSQKTGHARTGSGRRQSYRFAPASRMRNTFIEAGTDTFEDMIKSIDNGLYAAKLGGGSVKPGTGEFNFAVTEGYYVENGKIRYPVKSATLISTGPAVLKQISMVSDDLALGTGMCGSVSGSIPVTVGQPSLKVDDILVGGNA